jgi:hypothetical protein
MAKSESTLDLLSDEVKTKIQKAWRGGKRVIDLDGKKFNLERGRGKAGKPFILVLPVSGMWPMGQVEIERFGSSKLKDDKGNKLIHTTRRKGS